MIASLKEHFGRYRRPYWLLVALALLASAWAGYRYWHTARHKSVARLQVDLRSPDMVLSTRNLAELPKDVAAAPLLQGLVDQELVFHYEEDEARLSLEGSLRRLAYEHNLELQDHLLAALLNAPAEIGIWRSAKGRPEHYVAALERSALGKLVETVARIALNDRQLKQAGSFTIGGKTTTLFTLDLGGDRTLAFIAAGDRWVFLSNPALVLGSHNQLNADAEKILGELLRGQHPWQQRLPTTAASKHSLVIGPKALTLNYGHFLPALAGLRLNHDDHGWQPELRLDRQALPEAAASPERIAALWRQIPAQAALCAALPVDWQQVGAPLNTLVQDEAVVRATMNALDPLGAVCWFAGSRFNAPLLVAQMRDAWPAGGTQMLSNLVAKSWSTAAEQSSADGAERFTTRVASKHGLARDNAQERSFEAVLARRGKLLYFSPDRQQVDAALAVAAKQAPALGDVASMAAAPVWLFYDPTRLGKLVRAEVQTVLPADEESFFRDVARQRLWPRLEAWGQRHGATALAAGKAGTDGFVALDVVPVGNHGQRVP